ncbi:arginine--tRNA ligase [Arsenophonus endosymbiont of Lipoptena cervi]|uniref:arginine--tRNA ligase n=1 Tax=Arsenophonus endosymbiont of Lipoptena cervi TaxID=363258 RepID=UPI00376F18B8
MNIQDFISQKVSNALITVGAPKNTKWQVSTARRAEFGDYQVNGIISIAKSIGISPRELSKKILPLLKLTDIASKIELSGAGFINIFLNKQWISKQIEFILKNEQLVIKQMNPKTIIIDYSAPNIAKQMHVGHLRSTIIGDSIARILEFLGHKVIRANHIGDWGTHFGMLIAYLEKNKKNYTSDIILSDIETFYRQAKKHYDEDEDFAKLSRHYVVKLQSGDKHCKEIWRKLVNISINKNQQIYHRLNVTLTKKDIMSESFYNHMLPDIVTDLMSKGLAINNNGAIVVYLNEFKNKNGDAMGVIIKKKDGGYLYTTTDIACAKYRYETLHADRIIYYTDSRQHQHLMQVWAIVRKAGYIPEKVSLEHHMLGMMLDKNGKPFKTRDGGTIRLIDLLDEAVDRASKLIRSKNLSMPENKLQLIIQSIAVGAIKYADLSKKRTTNYIFDWDKMLSFEGNTAPYIQYAYTRIVSLLKKEQINLIDINESIVLTNEYEKKLAIRLLQFEETILTVACEGLPHIMCSYLYKLAGLFSSFYEYCPILNAENNILKCSRLKLAILTKKTLKIGLKLLGINTIERM